MKLRSILLFFCIIALTNSLIANENTDFETLQASKNLEDYLKFIEKHPQSKKLDEVHHLLFTQFPTLTNIVIAQTDDNLQPTLLSALQTLLKSKQYKHSIANVPKIQTPYQLHITLEFDEITYPGNLPAIKKYKITITLKKCIPELSQESNTVNVQYNLIYEKSFTADLPENLDKFLAFGSSSIDGLIDSINNTLINKIITSEIPEAEKIYYPKPVTQPDPTIDTDPDTTTETEPDITTETDPDTTTETEPIDVEPVKIPEEQILNYKNYEQQKSFELMLNLGFDLTSTESDNGGNFGTSEPSALSLEIAAIIQNLEIANCFVPYISAKALVMTETDETWQFQTNKISATIFDANIFLMLDFQRLINGEKDNAILKLGDSIGLFCFAGAGISLDIISLSRKDIMIVGFPHSNEDIDAILFGFSWFAQARLRGLFTPAFFINLNYQNSYIFNTEVANNFAITLTLGYDIILDTNKGNPKNVQLNPISIKASIALEFIFGHSEFVFSENDKFATDFAGFRLKFSIIL